MGRQIPLARQSQQPAFSQVTTYPEHHGHSANSENSSEYAQKVNSLLHQSRHDEDKFLDALKYMKSNSNML